MVDREILACLLKASHYREFLTEAFDLIKSQKPNFSYAALAKRGGFASRNAPRDVTVGVRRITSQTLPKFIKAWNLQGEPAQYFKLLVWEEEPDLCPDECPTRIRERRTKLGRRIHQRLSNQEKTQAGDLYRAYDWPKVYAALGGPSGSSLQDICERTGLTEHVCRNILLRLMERKLVLFSEDSKHYIAGEVNLSFDSMGEDNFFKKYFINSLLEAKRATDHGFDHKDAFFFDSIVSIKKEKIDELNEEFKQLLTRYIELAEVPDGETIQRLTVCFYNTRLACIEAPAAPLSS